MSVIAEKLQEMFPTEKNRQNFIIMSILTFGLTKESIASLLGISIDELLTSYVYPSNYSLSVNKRWHHISNSQNDAIMKFSTLVGSLYQAYLSKDRDAFKEGLSQITDKFAKNIIDARNPGDKISDEDILTILKYQIKYALSASRTALVFKIERKTYIRRVNKILELHPEYEEAYKSLATTNQQNALNSVTSLSEDRR